MFYVLMIIHSILATYLTKAKGAILKISGRNIMGDTALLATNDIHAVTNKICQSGILKLTIY